MVDPGKGPGGYSPSPVFLDQTEARRAEKNFLGYRPPTYLRVWMTAPPLPAPPPTYQGKLLHVQTILRIVTTLQLNNRV